MKKKREGGFIALTSVLIIGAVVLVLGVSLFHSALTDYSISSAYESGQEAAFLADFCLKEGVLKLKENIDYEGAEDIEVNDTTCYISLVENIDDNTKKVSSLGRAGDQPHFSRSSQLMHYVIESKESDWERGESENLEITEEGFLKLKHFEDMFPLNEARGLTCRIICQQENGYECTSVGIGSETADEGDMWSVFEENGGYSCLWIEQGVNCQSIMSDHSQELSDCNGHVPDWTYCKCEPEEVEGERTSPDFDISGPYTVKDSQIFWQADEMFDGTIEVEVRVFDGVEWGEWQAVSNGASIPGLEPGTSLSGVKIKTKTSFVGGPDFYPSLENIKIFIEIE